MAMFINYYQCPHCGDEWRDEWACQVEDDCPGCGLRHITPIESEECEDDAADDQEIDDCMAG